MSNKQSTGLKRDVLDKFYTNKVIVEECVSMFKQYIKAGENDLIIEPSAGDGAFIESIKNLGLSYKFYDIKPENELIKEQDFLKMKNPEKLNRKIHTITNPPYGRQSSMAIKFIKKSAEYSDTIAFILPKSFKKDSMKKHFPLNFHLIYQKDLPVNSFRVNEMEYDVPSIFQIWVKKDYNRETPKILKPKGFKFVKKEENPDMSFRRVGVYAGKFSQDIDKSSQSHYFIKFDTKINDEIIEKINNLKFDNKENTVGPKSISKQELIKELIVVL